MDGDIWALLQTLPTRQDIEALIFQVEETYRRDTQAVRADVYSLTESHASGDWHMAPT